MQYWAPSQMWLAGLGIHPPKVQVAVIRSLGVHPILHQNVRIAPKDVLLYSLIIELSSWGCEQPMKLSTQIPVS